MDEVTLLGLKIHRVRLSEALGVIDNSIRSKSQVHIVTADASMVIIAREDVELMQIVRDAELVTPDGAGIVWASKMLGKPIPERVSGVELVRQVCQSSSDPSKAYRIFFLGAAPGVAEQAAKNLGEMYPGCKIVGTRDGFFKADQEDAIVKAIAETHPDVVFVGFGIPKQEKFIKRYRDAMGASVYVGIGGSFDVYSGLVKRAPVWMQNAGIEWMYRLAQNPKKIAKVMTLPRFALLAIRTKLLGQQ